MRGYIDRIALKGRVINALFIRELMARFGHSNVGFLWQVLEPLVLALGVMVSWSLIYGARNHGVRVIPLVLTGYTFLTLWRHMTGRLSNSFRQASGLLFHRVVKPIDLLIARGLLESVGVLMAFFAAYIPLALLSVIDPVSDYLVLLGAWTLMCFLSFGVALIITGVTHLSETVERFVQPVMYLILPLTGVFYMVYWLPPAARQVMVLSPLVQACEMFRGGMFGHSLPTFWDPWYILLWGIGLNALGWVLVLKAQKHIEME